MQRRAKNARSARRALWRAIARREAAASATIRVRSVRTRFSCGDFAVMPATCRAPKPGTAGTPNRQRNRLLRQTFHQRWRLVEFSMADDAPAKAAEYLRLAQ